MPVRARVSKNQKLQRRESVVYVFDAGAAVQKASGLLDDFTNVFHEYVFGSKSQAVLRPFPVAPASKNVHVRIFAPL